MTSLSKSLFLSSTLPTIHYIGCKSNEKIQNEKIRYKCLVELFNESTCNRTY